jgi:RNA polymerase sigma-70 factor (ECF subfamily)
MTLHGIERTPEMPEAFIRPEPSPQSKVDDLLIRRFCTGELRCFEVLVTKYQRRVAALINASVRHHAVTEELTQETFLRAYRSLPNFRFESAFSTWLFTIARNLTNSYFRDGQVRADNAIPLDVLIETSSAQETAARDGLASGPDEHLSGLQLVAGIELSIANLSPRMRDAFLLREMDDLSYQEIAERLLLPLNTVRSLIFRARATIGSDIRPFVDKAISERFF